MSRFERTCAATILAAGLALPLAGHAQPVSDPQECGTSELEYRSEDGLTQAEIIARMDSAFVRSLNKYDECQDRRRAERENQTGSNSSADMAGGESGADSGGGDGQLSDSAGGSPGASTASSNISGQDAAPSQAASSKDADMAGTDDGTLSDAYPGSAGAGRGSVASTDLSGERPASQVGDTGEPASNRPSIAATDMSGTETPDPDDVPRNGGDRTDTSRQGQVSLSNGKLPEDIPPADNDSVLEAQIRQAAIEETDPVLKKKLWNEYRRYKGLPQVE